MSRLLVFTITMGLAATGHASIVNLYQFENNFTDSGSGASNGSPSGTPAFSTSVPSTSFPNNYSLSLGSSDAVSFNQPFVFDSNGDATLEFYVNPTILTGHEFIFWTTTVLEDRNRFNIFLKDNGAGGYTFNMDYREPTILGTAHGLMNPEVGGAFVNYVVPLNAWTFIAVARTGNTYSVYFDHNQTPTATVTDSSPNLPTSSGWTLNGGAAASGNPGFEFVGLLDEVRLSDVALTPSEFENAVPEPSTLGLLGVSLMALWKLRRR